MQATPPVPNSGPLDNDWLQHFEGTQQVLVNAHQSTCIVELPAVIRRGKDGHELAACKKLVAVLDNLVRTGYEIQVVLLAKASDNLRSKCEGHAPVVVAPRADFCRGVRPEQITQQPAVGNVDRTGQLPDLLQSCQLRRDPPMHAEDTVIYQCADRHVVEDIAECLPEFDVVAPLALIKEPIESVDGCALMVAAQDKEVLGVLCLERKQQCNAFDGVLPPVNVITQEEIVHLLRWPAVLKQPKHVVKLAVDVASDLHRRIQLQHHRLLRKDVLDPAAQQLELLLWDWHRPPLHRLLRAQLEQCIDDGIDIEDHLHGAAGPIHPMHPCCDYHIPHQANGAGTPTQTCAEAKRA
mmetsp:Transcript_7817/g.24315  ORF Transcript_7817/g.24315 Transcript_7817/m.24315 type:complete len:352 (-) Transcript_7817:3-1058(-)